METRTNRHFAGEDRDFWLPMARVIAFEREADCSIFALHDSIGKNLAESSDGTLLLVGPSEARLKACHSLIRNALIGAEMPEMEARDLVQTYCYPARPAIHDMELAYRILDAAILGINLPAGLKKRTGARHPLLRERGRSLQLRRAGYQLGARLALGVSGSLGCSQSRPDYGGARQRRPSAVHGCPSRLIAPFKPALSSGEAVAYSRSAPPTISATTLPRLTRLCSLRPCSI